MKTLHAFFLLAYLGFLSQAVDARKIKIRIERKMQCSAFLEQLLGGAESISQRSKTDPFFRKLVNSYGIVGGYEALFVPCSQMDALNILNICEVEVFSKDNAKLQLSGATQSSLYENGAGASKAIDNRYETTYRKASCPGGVCCSHTRPMRKENETLGGFLFTVRTKYAYWEADVDIGPIGNELNHISRVKIHNRNDCCGNRLIGSVVRIDSKPFEFITSGSRIVNLKPFLGKIFQYQSKEAINIGDVDPYTTVNGVMESLFQQDGLFIKSKDVKSLIGLDRFHSTRKSVHCLKSCPYPGDGVSKSEATLTYTVSFAHHNIETPDGTILTSKRLTFDLLKNRILEVLAASQYRRSHPKTYESWYCGCRKNEDKCVDGSDEMSDYCGGHCLINHPLFCDSDSDVNMGTVGEWMNQRVFPKNIAVKVCSIGTTPESNENACGSLALITTKKYDNEQGGSPFLNNYCPYAGVSNIFLSKVPLFGPLLAGSLSIVCLANSQNSPRENQLLPPTTPCRCPSLTTKTPVDVKEVINGTEITYQVIETEQDSAWCDLNPKMCAACLTGDPDFISRAEEQCAADLWPLEVSMEQVWQDYKNVSMRANTANFPAFDLNAKYDEPCVCPFTDFEEADEYTPTSIDLNLCMFRHAKFCQACLRADRVTVDKLRNECSAFAPLYDQEARAAREAEASSKSTGTNSDWLPLGVGIPVSFIAGGVAVATGHWFLRKRSTGEPRPGSFDDPAMETGLSASNPTFSS